MRLAHLLIATLGLLAAPRLPADDAAALAALRGDDRDAFREAAASLRDGAACPPAIAEALVARLDDRHSEFRLPAARALGRARGAPVRAVPALARRLADPITDVAIAAAAALERYADDARPAAGALRAALEHDDGRLRVAAALALHAIDPEDASILATLDAAQRDDEPAVRVEALAALARVARRLDVAPALPGAIAALKSEGALRERAFVVLRAYRGDLAACPEAVAAVGLLCDLLREDGAGPAAAAVLGRLGARARAAMPDLLGAIDGRWIGAEGIDAVARIASDRGPDCERVARRIVGLPELDQDDLRAAARRALAAVEPDRKTTSDELEVGVLARIVGAWLIGLIGEGGATPPFEIALREMRSETANERRQAVSLLGVLDDSGGEHAGEVLVRVTRTDLDASVRAAAARALSDLRRRADVVVFLAALTDEDDADVRVAAARALGALAADARPAAEALAHAMDGDADGDVRAAAAIALMRVEPDRWGTALPTMLALVRDGAVDEAVAAARELGRLGPAAREAVPVLLAATREGHSLVGCEAVKALARIAPDDPRVIDGLRELLKKPQSIAVQNAVEKTLRELGAPARD